MKEEEEREKTLLAVVYLDGDMLTHLSTQAARD